MSERELFMQAYTNLRSADSIPFPDAVFDEFIRLRQGYKLVPVDELLRKAQNIRALNTGEYASDEIEENVCEIEIMIGEHAK